jgi:hypothetical protein
MPMSFSPKSTISQQGIADWLACIIPSAIMKLRLNKMRPQELLHCSDTNARHLSANETIQLLRRLNHITIQSGPRQDDFRSGTRLTSGEIAG